MPEKKERYSPRFMGLGGRFVQQAVAQQMVKVVLSPLLREKIRLYR